MAVNDIPREQVMSVDYWGLKINHEDIQTEVTFQINIVAAIYDWLKDIIFRQKHGHWKQSF